jgi:hypothetical protein
MGAGFEYQVNGFGYPITLTIGGALGLEKKPVINTAYSYAVSSYKTIGWQLREAYAYLPYLTQIWRKVVASRVFKGHKNQDHVVSGEVVTIESGQVTHGTLEISGDLSALTTQFGVHNIMKAGYYRWRTGGKDLDLQPINFDMTWLVPPTGNCNELQVFLPEGVEAWIQLCTSDDPLPGVTMGDSLVINPLNDEPWGGITYIGETSILENLHQGKPGMVFINAGDQLEQQEVNTGTWVGDTVFSPHPENLEYVIQNLLQQIWHQTVCKDFGQSESSFPGKTESFEIAIQDRFLNSAVIEYTHPPQSKGNKFGTTGAPYLGKYAWMYDAYFGKCHPINSNTTWTQPDHAGATGLYVWTKKGSICRVTVQHSPAAALGTTTPNGVVNLLTGDTSGLYNVP